MTMPNFLIIGAAKSGTTSLYYILKQHPEVFMSPVKEPHFFSHQGARPAFRGPGDSLTMNRNAITTIKDYRGLFRGVTNEKAIGEASTSYLYTPKAPDRIKQQIPEARLIAMLRNPVDRAYSAFMHLSRDGREPHADFARALEEEQRRIGDNYAPLWQYTKIGMYASQVERYFKTFDRSRIKIYLYDDYKADAGAVVRDMFRFLGVDESYPVNLRLQHNVSGAPKNRLINSLLSRPTRLRSALRLVLPQPVRHVALQVRNRNLVKRPLPPDIRNHLNGVFREDILKLQDLIERDLSVWIK